VTSAGYVRNSDGSCESLGGLRHVLNVVFYLLLKLDICSLEETTRNRS